MNIYGSIVALITPFHEDGSIDYETFKKLVTWHIEEGTQSILVGGTTGESGTLTKEEVIRLVKTTQEICQNKIPVIVGMSANCTSKAKAHLEELKQLNPDAVLVLTPYYNKPPQEGIFKHFEELNKQNVPLIIYNCPGRTASNVEAETTLRMARELENVVSVKEASGNLDQIKEILEKRPEGFKVYSGDDSISHELLPFGLDGCISVVANEFPKLFQELFSSFKEGNTERSQEIHNTLAEIMDQNFIETNPIPVKTALEIIKITPSTTFRLPLVPLKPENLEILKQVLCKLK